MILFALGLSTYDFIVELTPKDLISSKESIFYINTSSFLDPSNVGRYNKG
jgi:hypothetical protein